VSALVDDRPELNTLEGAEASLAEQVEALVMQVTRLEDKLSPVLEQSPEAGRGNSEKTANPSFGTSKHLRFLSQTYDIIEATKERIERLRNRLEM